MWLTLTMRDCIQGGGVRCNWKTTLLLLLAATNKGCLQNLPLRYKGKGTQLLSNIQGCALLQLGNKRGCDLLLGSNKQG